MEAVAPQKGPKRTAGRKKAATAQDSCNLQVFFDLETTGLHCNCEILQLAAKSSGSATPPFSVYALPLRGIPQESSAVNGLTMSDGHLQFHGQVVEAVDLKTALEQFVGFLKQLGQPVVLVGHYCDNFDTVHLMKALREHGLQQDFCSVVRGFADTLRILRELNKEDWTRWKKQPSYKLTELARQYFPGYDPALAHEGGYDVLALEGICQALQLGDALLSRAKTLKIVDNVRVEAPSVTAPQKGSKRTAGRKKAATAQDSCNLQVFFDLETTGLDWNCEILQLAAKSSGSATPPFSVYALPLRGIPQESSAVNGLTMSDGHLQFHGQIVEAVDLKTALEQFVGFLKQLGQPVVLVGHYCDNFDTVHLMKALREHGLQQDFCSVVRGFADTLRILRELNKEDWTRWKKQPSYKLTDLARRYFPGYDPALAHEAAYDVLALEGICQALQLSDALLSRAKTLKMVGKRVVITKKRKTSHTL